LIEVKVSKADYTLFDNLQGLSSSDIASYN